MACAPVKTKTSFDEKVDFTKYESFCWLSGCEFVYEGPHRYNDSVAINKIKEALVKELESKGLVRNENNPDLLIDFHIIIEEKSTLIVNHPEYNEGYETAYDPTWEIYNYLKGSLIVDMVDNSESRMIWRSHSIGFLEAFPTITDKQIERSVREALKDFPPEN